MAQSKDPRIKTGPESGGPWISDTILNLVPETDFSKLHIRNILDVSFDLQVENSLHWNSLIVADC